MDFGYTMTTTEFIKKGQNMFRKYFNKGIGLSILALLALIVSWQATSVIKKYMQEQVPNFQETLNQLAPLKIENGTVVEPINSYKEAYLKVLGDDNERGFKIVIDTKDDTIDLNKIKDDVASIHLAKKKLYFVKKNEISQTDLSALTLHLEPKDYQEQMKKGISYWGNIMGIFVFVVLTLYYLVCAIIFAIVSFLYTIGQADKPDFAARIRVSAVALFITSAIDMLLIATTDTGLNSSIYVLAIILISLTFMRFVPIWKNKE